MGKLRFPLFIAGTEVLGDLNPQLLRELQGRLKLRNVLLAVCCSLLGQGFFLFWQYQQLDLIRGLCENAADPKGRNCVQLGTHYLLVNWQQWWLAVFAWGSFLLLLVLVVGGSFLLISDLSKEERRGTLTFVSLSPQSAWTILVGKLLGVPILIFLSVMVALPLRYISGLSAQIPFLKILSFDVLVLGCGLFFYSVALLIGLVGYWLNGFQAWLGSAIICALLFLFNNLYISHSSVDWIYGFSPVTLLPYLAQTSDPALPYRGSLPSLLNWQFFGLPLGSNGLFVLMFVLANYGLWTGWLWQPLQRRFRNPQIPLLSKKQSYWATACVVTCWLGFSLGPKGSTEELISFLLILHMLWFVLLMVLLLPHHQALQDWARFRGTYRSARGRVQRTKDLIWADDSPAWVAIALNLGIANFPIVAWAFWHLKEEQMLLLMGLLFNSTLILVLALFNQVVLLRPISNRNLWATATLTVPVVLPLVLMTLLGADTTNTGAIWFLLTPFAFMAVEAIPLAQILTALGLQLVAIAGLTMQLNRQLRQSGESTTERLLGGEIPVALGE
ncbi:hypothetical protein C1752_05066 [Acaryochloris thomasi RCC1774]|uniref:Uncharacterized protein n=1 Tax=Acaryochloris thomasi RCC1774 TaxID=1764569 RepID=A0A2W1JN81_9CYAN|nr:hypothetical protein [Acaryochloris thomasi]PZD71604.1 hypothetical protein C1752_05066 [Acaryochloris thomasi RCC1774]